MQLMDRRSSKHFSLQSLFIPVAVTGFLFLMLLFPIASLEGAKIGLSLWFNTILPTLLPFIILSNIVIRLNITKYICFLFSPILKRLFRVTDNGCYPIIMGLLSGYPLSAKTCADLEVDGSITKDEGQYLLVLCNNASFMFITSYIAISKLNMPSIKYHVLGIIYLSSILSAMLYRIYEFKKGNYSTKINQNLIANSTIANESTNRKIDFRLIDESILDGFEVITKIGGYIILFSILATILSSVGPEESIFKLLTMGLLEITTGIDYICNSALDLSKKIVLTITITAFGGLSSIAQTKSVIDNSRLSIKTYVKVKLINLILAFFLSVCYVGFLLPN